MSVRQVVRPNTCSDSRSFVGESRSLDYEEALAKLKSFKSTIDYYVTDLVLESALFSSNDCCASYLHFAIVPLSILLPEHQQQFPTENSYGHDITSIQNS